MPLPAMRAAVAIERGHPDEGRDGAAVETAQLRQLGEQRPRGRRTDPWHTAQQVLVHAPDRAGLDRSPDVVVDGTHAPFQPPNVIAQVPGDPAGGRCLLEAPSFHADHLDQLAATRYERRQGLRLGVGERARRRLHARAEVGEHIRVDVVRLRSRPRACAKARTCRGLATATGRPTAAHAATSACS
jgi:hypothetical protein